MLKWRSVRSTNIVLDQIQPCQTCSTYMKVYFSSIFIYKIFLKSYDGFFFCFYEGWTGTESTAPSYWVTKHCSSWRYPQLYHLLLSLPHLSGLLYLVLFFLSLWLESFSSLFQGFSNARSKQLSFSFGLTAHWQVKPGWVVLLFKSTSDLSLMYSFSIHS